jgi:hypothetical protein
LGSELEERVESGGGSDTGEDEGKDYSNGLGSAESVGLTYCIPDDEVGELEGSRVVHEPDCLVSIARTDIGKHETYW